MFLKKNNPQTTGLMLIDLLSLVISFFAAVYTRFYNEGDWEQINSWNGGLYYMLLELVLAINVVVFLLNETRHRPIHVQNPLEKLINVIKNNLIQTAFLVVLLYLIKQGFWASRAVVLGLFAYNIVLDFIFRFIYGRYIWRKLRNMSGVIKYMLLVSSTSAEAALRRIQAGIRGSKSEISGIILTDENIVSQEFDGIKVLGSIANIEDTIKNYDFDEIVYYADGTREENIEIIKVFNDLRRPLNVIPLFDGDLIHSEEYERIGDIEGFRLSFMAERSSVLGVDFAVTNIREAVDFVRDNVKKFYGKYICFSNVHTTVMACENDEYRKAQNEALIVFPDGAPISKLQRRRGRIRAERVAGPDFMREIFLTCMNSSLSMYFYGSSPETIDALKKNLEKNYPGLDVRGYESPPFRQLSREEDEEAIKRINDSGADILWVGLGAPKQEMWMNAHKDRINALMCGVGAGFDFHAGTIKRAPEWLQHVGLEWLYRLFQDPKRLIRRYLITNLKFLVYILRKNE